MTLELAFSIAATFALEVSVDSEQLLKNARSLQLTAHQVELLRMEKVTSVWFTDEEKEQMASDPLLKRISQGVVGIYPTPYHPGSEWSVDAVRTRLRRPGTGRDVKHLQVDIFGSGYIHSGLLILADYTAVRWYWCSVDSLYLSEVLDGEGGLRWYRDRTKS